MGIRRSTSPISVKRTWRIGSLWAFALEHFAVIVTKDEDFAQMVVLTDHSPVIVWVRVGNTRLRELLAWFDPLIEQVASMVESGQRLIELR